MPISSRRQKKGLTLSKCFRFPEKLVSCLVFGHGDEEVEAAVEDSVVGRRGEDVGDDDVDKTGLA